MNLHCMETGDVVQFAVNPGWTGAPISGAVGGLYVFRNGRYNNHHYYPIIRMPTVRPLLNHLHAFFTFMSNETT